MSTVIAGRCTHCGYRVDRAASTTGDEAPADGDISICFRCGNADAYAVGPSGISIRALTADERPRVMANPQVRRVIAAIQRLN